MAPQQQISQDANATDPDKQPDVQGTKENDKAEAPVNEKAAPERESLPGWTRLRTMKLRGLKNRGNGSAASTPSSVSTNLGNGESVDSKRNDELKVMQTNSSGNGPHEIGEVEALHEVRSDDELLGDEEGDSAPQRATAGTQGDGNDGGEGVERTASGGEYKVYKRRWFGLVQLVLLNIIVSWDVSCRLCSSASRRLPLLMHNIVALLLCQLHDYCTILQCDTLRCQLVEHGVPLRIRGCGTPGDLHPASWGPKTIDHHSLSPHPAWKLDQIRCNQSGKPWQFWRSYVWSNLDRLGPTICPCCAYEIFRPVVYK